MSAGSDPEEGTHGPPPTPAGQEGRGKQCGFQQPFRNAPQCGQTQCGQHLRGPLTLEQRNSLLKKRSVLKEQGRGRQSPAGSETFSTHGLSYPAHRALGL